MSVPRKIPVYTTKGIFDIELRKDEEFYSAVINGQLLQLGQIIEPGKSPPIMRENHIDTIRVEGESEDGVLEDALKLVKERFGNILHDAMKDQAP